MLVATVQAKAQLTTSCDPTCMNVSDLTKVAEDFRKTRKYKIDLAAEHGNKESLWLFVICLLDYKSIHFSCVSYIIKISNF